MKKILLLLGPFLLAFVTPTLISPVMDQAGLLAPSTRQLLEHALRALNDKGGTQMVVLSVPSLDELKIEQATIQITDEWQLGKKGEDRGILLLIAQKERKMRIEVGLGLQHLVPDVTAKHIIADVMQPLFRQGDFSSGVILAVREIVRRTDPDFPIDEYLQGVPKSVHSNQPGTIPLWVILLLLLFMFLLFSGGGRSSGVRPGRYYGGGRRGGSWDPFGGRGGGGGGGGFGGFSGGGGGFNGGGASGDW